MRQMDNDKKRRIKTAHEAEMDEMSRRMSDAAKKQARHRPYCCDMIRAQGEQLKRRPTFRDLLDRIMDGVNSGEIMMSDPVPDGFLQDGHIGVAEYFARKYNIRGDADE